MIVPRNRLIFWTGAVVPPFIALASAVPSAVGVSSAVITLFLGTALIDALLARRGLRGVRIDMPEIVRLTQGREGAVPVVVESDRSKPSSLRLGLAFPPELSTPREETLIALPAGGRTARFSWPCTPLKRGRYLFDACHLEAPSFLGLWGARSSRPLRVEVRAYPNLFPERKNLAVLFLNRENFGFQARRRMGQGREFEKLREYIHGDNYGSIHWKTTAKRSHPVTKVFQIERLQEVYVIVDASRLSARTAAAPSDGEAAPPSSGGGEAPARSQMMIERFITAALIMGLAAERQGDLFGVAAFSDRVQSFIRAKSGRGHYNSCRDALYRLEPRTVTPDYDELCSFLGLRLRRRALLIFFTNLDDPVLAESFQRNMELLRTRHLVLVNMLKPAGVRPLFSDAAAESTEDLYRRLGGHMLWRNLRELERNFRRRGIRFSLLDSERVCPQTVSLYMEVKQRELL
jgi:uncharacterized protein (DUF58 family)